MQAGRIRRVFGVQCKVSVIPYMRRAALHTMGARAGGVARLDACRRLPSTTRRRLAGGGAAAPRADCQISYVCCFVRRSPARGAARAEPGNTGVSIPGAPVSGATSSTGGGLQEGRAGSRKGAGVGFSGPPARPAGVGGHPQKLFITAPTTQALLVSSLRRNSLKT